MLGWCGNLSCVLYYKKPSLLYPVPSSSSETRVSTIGAVVTEDPDLVLFCCDFLRLGGKRDSHWPFVLVLFPIQPQEVYACEYMVYIAVFVFIAARVYRDPAVKWRQSSGVVVWISEPVVGWSMFSDNVIWIEEVMLTFTHQSVVVVVARRSTQKQRASKAKSRWRASVRIPSQSPSQHPLKVPVPYPPIEAIILKKRS